MSTIVEFLNARLNEDEVAAVAANDGDRWAAITDAADGMSYVAQVDPSGQHWRLAVANRNPAEHIARHDPVRVSADIAAERVIVRLLDECDYLDPMPDIDGNFGPPSTAVLIARHFAAVYSDHPDYQQEWKP